MLRADARELAILESWRRALLARRIDDVRPAPPHQTMQSRSVYIGAAVPAVTGRVRR